MHEVHVSYATNSDYLPYCWVSIKSLLKHHLGFKKNLHLWILTTLENRASLKPLKTLAEQVGVELDFVAPSKGLIAGIKSRGNFSIETYFQLLLPKLLPVSVERVLHLDPDTLITGDIIELCQFPLDSGSVAAVEDRKPAYAENLGIAKSDIYFNTGMVLYDLQKLRKSELLSKSLDYAKEHHENLVAVDQDAFNTIARNETTRLHPKWNWMPFMSTKQALELPHTSLKELRDAVADPRIVHFAGGQKPWKYLTVHPYKSMYRQYLKNSPWPELDQSDKKFSQAPKKFGRWIRSLKRNF